MLPRAATRATPRGKAPRTAGEEEEDGGGGGGRRPGTTALTPNAVELEIISHSAMLSIFFVAFR